MIRLDFTTHIVDDKAEMICFDDATNKQVIEKVDLKKANKSFCLAVIMANDLLKKLQNAK